MFGPPREDEDDRLLTEDAALDIGGDVGALLLYTGPEQRGREVEVSPVGQELLRVHTAIHARRVQGHVVFAGLFPQLVAGDYQIWTDDPTLPDRVTIVGGEVAEVDWRPPDAAS